MDGAVATVQEDEMWPDEHGNLDTSFGITDSYDDKPVNDEESEDIPTSDDDNDDSATLAMLKCGLEITTEKLQVTADIEKPIYPNARIMNATSY